MTVRDDDGEGGVDVQPAAPHVRPYGEHALLVDVPSAHAARALARRLEGEPGVVDVVGSAASALVVLAEGSNLGAVRERLHRIVPALPASAEAGSSGESGALVELLVDYDGEDLDAVALATGLTVSEVISRHTAPTYRAAFAGFAPGFVYLEGLDPALDLPRREVPRTRVPAGSVAVAAGLSAVYPRQGPGGWHLLGRTDAVMFDVDASPPSLVRPGDRVRFVDRKASGQTGRSAAPAPAPARDAAGSRAAGAAPAQAHPPAHPAAPRSRAAARPRAAALQVLSVVGAATVVDLGRPGRARFGVGPSGASDPAALRGANAVVGNEEGAACLEVLLGPLVLRPTRTVVVAVVGPAQVSIDGLRLEAGRAIAVTPSATLEVRVTSGGLRAWLAVAGGLDLPLVLGSRSWDSLAALGPAPLRSGDVLEVGQDVRQGVHQATPDRALAPSTPSGWDATSTGPDDVCLVPVLPPPRPSAVPGGFAALLAHRWNLGPDSDRVAVRLTGQPIPQPRGDAPSEGLVRGAVQLPPSGLPLVFGADHPLTGGYPVIAVATAAGCARLAQVRPGQPVRFVAEPATMTP